MPSDAPSSSETTLPVLVVKPFGQNFEAVLRKFGADSRLSPSECPSTADAVARAKQLDWGFVLCYVADESDLDRIGTLTRVLGPHLKRKHARLCVVVGQGVNHAIESNLKFFGVTEVIFEPVPERALMFKLERHLRAQHQQMTRDRAVGAQRVAGRAEGGAGAGGKTRGRIVWGAPLVLQSDFWLTSKVEAKEIMDRWLIRLHGPSLAFGKWGKAKEGEADLWQWLPAEPTDDPFVRDPGAWYFRGMRPDLKAAAWHFTGPKPELFWKHEDKPVLRKMHLDGSGNLVVARDSDAAFALAQEISESHYTSPSRAGEESALKQKVSARTNDSAAKENQHRVRMVAPLSLLSDCWLLDQRNPRRVSGKWLIRLTGPGPAVGRWEPRAGESKGSDRNWQWVPTDGPKDEFIRDPGSWFCQGLLPKFQEETWIFAGKRPTLVFRFNEADKAPAAKFQVDEHEVLLIAKDSPQALAARPALMNSIQRLIRGEETEEDGVELMDAEKEKKRRLSSSSSAGAAEDSETAEDAGSLESEEAEEVELQEFREGRGTSGEAEEDGGDTDEACARAEAGESPDKKRRSADEESVDYRLRKKADRLSSDPLSGEVGPEKKGSGEDYTDAADPRAGRELSLDAEKDAKSGRELSIERDARSEGKELSAEQGKTSQGKELSAELGKAPPGKELSAEQGGPSSGKELSAEQGGKSRGKELALELGARGEGRELSAKTENENGRDLESREKAVNRPSDLNAPEAGASASDAKAAGGKSAPGAEDGPAETGAADAGSAAPAPPRLDAAMEQATDPAKPSLGPIALACLMSELVMRRDMSGEMIARKYCDYLSKASGGMRVELWVRPDAGAWVCAGSNAGDPGRCSAPLLEQCITSMTVVIQNGFAGTPVRRPGGAAVPIGALILSGPRAEIIPPAWILAAAQMTSGLAMTFERGALKPVMTSASSRTRAAA